MLFWAQIAYATVAGFAAAALIGALYENLAEQKPTFARIVETNWQGLHVVFLAVLAGPWIVAMATINGRVEKRISLQLFTIGLMVSGLWSLCFGIVLISLFQA